MLNHKTVTEAITYRRSVRIYDPEKPIDSAIVKKCLENAALAPNSSNMQLWEFYHITDKETINKFTPLCFNQDGENSPTISSFCYRKISGESE